MGPTFDFGYSGEDHNVEPDSDIRGGAKNVVESLEWPDAAIVSEKGRSS